MGEGGCLMKKGKSLLFPPEFACKRGLLPQVSFIREDKITGIFREPSMNNSASMCRKYVCFVWSYHTCQIHMSMASVGSVAFIYEAEGISCTKTVMMASGNVRACLL